MGFLYNKKENEWVFIGTVEMYEKYRQAIDDYIEWMKEERCVSVPSNMGRPIVKRKRKKKAR